MGSKRGTHIDFRRAEAAQTETYVRQVATGHIEPLTRVADAVAGKKRLTKHCRDLHEAESKA